MELRITQFTENAIEFLEKFKQEIDIQDRDLIED